MEFPGRSRDQTGHGLGRFAQPALGLDCHDLGVGRRGQPRHRRQSLVLAVRTLGIFSMGFFLPAAAGGFSQAAKDWQHFWIVTSVNPVNGTSAAAIQPDPHRASSNARRFQRNSKMFPSCGWSHEILIVNTGPRFSRSISGDSSNCAVNAGSFVIAVTTSDGPICLSIPACGTWTTLAYGNRNSRFASGCANESHRTMVGRKYMPPSNTTLREAPLSRPSATLSSSDGERAGVRSAFRYFAVTSAAPGVFKPSSICASIAAAIFGFAKPDRFAFSSFGFSGATAPGVCACASAISAAYFGTTMAEALTQLRPPLSEMLDTITSTKLRQFSISSSPMRILL